MGGFLKEYDVSNDLHAWKRSQLQEAISVAVSEFPQPNEGRPKIHIKTRVEWITASTRIALGEKTLQL